MSVSIPTKEEISLIEKFFQPYRERANSEISRIIWEYEKTYPIVPQYTSSKSFEHTKKLLLGGKRFRYILACASYEAVSGSDSLYAIARPACWVELFHPYTLWLDDIMDEDEKRRDIDSSWFAASKLYSYEDAKGPAKIFSSKATRYGVSMGILDGIVLFSLAKRAVESSNLPDAKKLEIISQIDDTNLAVSWGQKLDIDFEKLGNLTEKQYEYMSSYKTGALYQAAINTGAIIGGATVGQKNALKNYALHLALAFQDRDDLLGSGVAGKDIGKPSDSDIRKGKKTRLRIWAEKMASGSQLKILEEYGNEKISSENVEKIREILFDSGAVKHVEDSMMENINKALQALSAAGLYSKPQHYILKNLARFQLVREK